MASKIITQEYLRQILHYDPETGIFTWLKTMPPRARKGAVAGHVAKNGRPIIGLHQKCYYSYRLAWLWMTGEWPIQDIDHKDGNPSNNRFSNLRLCTMSQNQQNRRKACGDTHSGLLGVYPQAYGSWYARIKTNGKLIHLGTYITKEEAHAAYVKAKRKYHEFNQL